MRGVAVEGRGPEGRGCLRAGPAEGGEGEGRGLRAGRLGGVLEGGAVKGRGLWGGRAGRGGRAAGRSRSRCRARWLAAGASGHCATPPPRLSGVRGARRGKGPGSPAPTGHQPASCPVSAANAPGRTCWPQRRPGRREAVREAVRVGRRVPGGLMAPGPRAVQAPHPDLAPLSARTRLTSARGPARRRAGLREGGAERTQVWGSVRGQRGGSRSSPVLPVGQEAGPA